MLEPAGKEVTEMKIALPLVGGKLSMHFGHCEEFAFVEVDPEKKAIERIESLPAPLHQPGLLPQWLSERGAQMIIAGGMGRRAQELFEEEKIKVLVGAPSEAPEAIVNAYLNGALETGENICDH